MLENLSSRFVKDKGADQPAQSDQLVSAAEETGLSPTMLETLQTGFVTSNPIFKWVKVQILRNPELYKFKS